MNGKKLNPLTFNGRATHNWVLLGSFVVAEVPIYGFWGI
jgi:hypothetical protein